MQMVNRIGLAVAAVPSKRIPEVVKAMTDHYVEKRQPDESFQAFIRAHR